MSLFHLPVQRLLFASAVLAALAAWGMSLEAQCPPPPGAYTLAAVVRNPADGCVGLPVDIDILGGSTGGPIDGFGFNITLTGTPVLINSVGPGFPPAPPAGFNFNMSPAGDAICALGFFPAAGPGLTLLATINLTLNPPGNLTIAFGGTLALPTGIVPVDSVVVAGCDVFAPTLVASGAAIRCPGFIRGDCNSNGLVAGFVGDVVFLFNYLFLSGRIPGCINACDANDDGQVQLTDGVYLVSWMFIVASPPPPVPFGAFPAACGVDPTPSPMLTCLAPVCP